MAFRGNVALISGAGSGMGQLMAWRLAAAGVQVAALDVDEAGLSLTARRAPQITPYVCDVRDFDRVCEVVATVENDIGPIDRLVTAAAIAPAGAMLDQPMDQIKALIDINFLGTVHLVKAALPAMIERRSGDCVIFGSLAGWLPSPNFAAYTATKFATVAMAETLAFENQNCGVRICCVCPPVVDTPLLTQIEEHNQALLDAAPPIRPEVVLDAIEAGLERGDLFIFPGRGTKAIQRIRRFAPALLWKRMADEMAKASLPSASIADGSAN